MFGASIRSAGKSQSDLRKERPVYSPGRFAGGEVCERHRIVRGRVGAFSHQAQMQAPANQVGKALSAAKSAP